MTRPSLVTVTLILTLVVSKSLFALRLGPSSPHSKEFVVPGGGFVFVFRGPEMQNYPCTGLYKNDGSREPVWTMDTYGGEIAVSPNGQHAAIVSNWGLTFQQAAVSFYENGKPLRRYRVYELISNPWVSAGSTAPFSWQTGPITVDWQNSILQISTVAGDWHKFDLSTGDLVASGYLDRADHSMEWRNVLEHNFGAPPDGMHPRIAEESLRLLESAMSSIHDQRSLRVVPYDNAFRGDICSDLRAGTGVPCSELFEDTGEGPDLVVIPNGNGIDKPYAITAREISRREYQTYCASTGACPVAHLKKQEGSLPVTNISVSDAANYGKWLSKRTLCATYRLPTQKEWTNATAGWDTVEQLSRNCRITSGDSVIAGHALQSVKSSRPTPWGLEQLVGNAREWVTDAHGALKAIGGSFEDPLTICGPTLVEDHDGRPDNTTGFRLVRIYGHP